MKRILAWITDIFFYLSLIFIVSVVALADIYYMEHDISIVNTFLQSSLLTALLSIYIVLLLIYFVYFIIVPVKLKGTLGHRLFGLAYESSNSKVSVSQLFKKVFVGRFWEIVLFPYTLFLKIKKKDSISTKLSGIVLIKSEIKSTKSFYVLVGLFSIFLIMMIGTSTYIYRAGVGPIIERLTDYRKQVENMIEIHAFTDAEVTLEKYKQYSGETKEYLYYNCIIQGELNSNVEDCDIAIENNNDNPKWVENILLLEARVLAGNEEYELAEEKYNILWEDYNIRSLEMINYIVVLFELNREEITPLIEELSNNLDMTNTSTARDIADLYTRSGAKLKATEVYVSIFEMQPEESSDRGETAYYIGVLLYDQKEYKEARSYFEVTKETNKDFAEAAESYIILIDDLAKSIVK